MLSKLKKKVQEVLTKEVKTAHEIGLRPNTVSFIGAVFAFISALAYMTWHVHTVYVLLATCLLLVSGFCDVLDGALARLYHQTTAFGGFLDSVLDRYADAIIYTGIIVGGLCEVSWGVAAVIGSMLVSYTRARAESIGIEMESVGLAERAERMIILAVAGSIATFWQPQTVMNVGIIVVAILSNLTVLQRGLHAYNELNKKNKLKS